MVISKLDKKYKMILLLLIILFIFVLIVGISYAFFVIQVSGEGNATIVKSGEIVMNFYDGPEVKANNLMPGDSVTKEFTIKNIGSLDATYDVYFSNVINTFVRKNDLVFTVSSVNGCSSTIQKVAPSSSGEIAVEQCLIPTGEEHLYTLTLTYLNTDEIQNDNMGKIFSTELSVNDYSRRVIASNVSELKATDANVGDYVITSGYYSENDGGQSRYIVEEKKNQIIDDGRYIELNNGNVAKLIILDKTIDVRQYGAKGDGVSDDTSIIQTVYNQLKEDDCNTITFTKGSYVITDGIVMPSGNYIGKDESKIVIKGIKKTSWGDEYSFDTEEDLTNNKIIIDNMHYEVDMQTDGTNHISLLRLINTNDSKILNSKFTTAEGNTYGVCAIDLYSNNHGIEIDHMYSRLYGSDISLSSFIAVRDSGWDKAGSSNIKITNLDGRKNGSDECIWVGWLGNIENVEIANSRFVDEGTAPVSFLFAPTKAGKIINNVSFHDNEVIKENFCHKIISIATAMSSENYGATSKNVHVYNNMIKVNSVLDKPNSGNTYLILVGDPSDDNPTNENILIEDNTFIAENVSIGSGIGDIGMYNVAVAKNNIFKVDGINSSKYNGIYCGLKELSGGSITKVDGSPLEATYVLRNNSYVHDLTIENARSGGMMVQDWVNKRDSLYRNCNFKSKGAVFMFAQKSTIGQNVTIENSTANTPYGIMFIAQYTDLNSATSTDKAVNITIRNSVFNKYTTYGTINVIRE